MCKSTRLGHLNQVKVSEHFDLSEFECKGGTCCGYVAKIEPELLEWLEKLRAKLCEYLGRDTSLYITSGYRCPRHNLKIGGVTKSMDPRDTRNSFHCQGMAADVASPGVRKEVIAWLAAEIGFPRVGLYRKRKYDGQEHLVLHLDIANAREIGTEQVFGDGWKVRPDEGAESDR